MIAPISGTFASSSTVAAWSASIDGNRMARSAATRGPTWRMPRPLRTRTRPRDRLAAIDKISDPELQRQKLAALHADLDQMAKDIAADPASARVLETINTKAVVKGMENKPEIKA
jgi:hypothetical protein